MVKTKSKPMLSNYNLKKLSKGFQFHYRLIVSKSTYTPQDKLIAPYLLTFNPSNTYRSLTLITPLIRTQKNTSLPSFPLTTLKEKI